MAGVLVGAEVAVEGDATAATTSKDVAPRSPSSDVAATEAASEAVDAASWRRSSAWWASAAMRQLRPAAASSRLASSRARRHCCFTAVSTAAFARASRSSLSAISRSSAARKRRFKAVLWAAISSEVDDTTCGEVCTGAAGGVILGLSRSLCFSPSVLIFPACGSETDEPFQAGMWGLPLGAVAMVETWRRMTR